MTAARAHWYRVGTIAGLLLFGLVSLLAVIEGVARVAKWLGGVQ